jgi:hypothetical protein
LLNRLIDESEDLRGEMIMICKINNVPKKALRGKSFHLIVAHFFIQKVIEGYAEALFANFSNPWLQSFQLNGILCEIWQ